MIRVINRSGIILPQYSTENQCGNDDTISCYHYKCRVVFNKNQHLDSNGWLIDHKEIDKAIKRTIISSCEEMANTIITSLIEVLDAKNIRVDGIKVTINHNNHQAITNGAYFEAYLAFPDVNSHIYSILN